MGDFGGGALGGSGGACGAFCLRQTGAVVGRFGTAASRPLGGGSFGGCGDAFAFSSRVGVGVSQAAEEGVTLSEWEPLPRLHQRLVNPHVPETKLNPCTPFQIEFIVCLTAHSAIPSFAFVRAPVRMHGNTDVPTTRNKNALHERALRQ